MPRVRVPAVTEHGQLPDPVRIHRATAEPDLQRTGIGRHDPARVRTRVQNGVPLPGPPRGPRRSADHGSPGHGERRRGAGQQVHHGVRCAAALPKRSCPPARPPSGAPVPRRGTGTPPQRPKTARHHGVRGVCAWLTDARARPSSSWEQRESRPRVWRRGQVARLSWRTTPYRRRPDARLSTAHVLMAVPAAAPTGARPSRSTASPASTAAPVTTPTCTAPATGWSIRIRRSLARATRASEAPLDGSNHHHESPTRPAAVHSPSLTDIPP